RYDVNAFYNFEDQPGDIDIDHIEVVQTINTDVDHQSIPDIPTVPLVAGKATVVRVYLKSVGRNAKDISQGITGSLTDDLIGLPRFPLNQPIASPKPDPDNPRHSMNFQLPLNYTAAGTLNLRAKLSLNGGPAREALATARFENPPN